MLWDNSVRRELFVAERGHSLVFEVRLETRVHKPATVSGDKCVFVVRPDAAPYPTAKETASNSVLTIPDAGVGILSEGVLTGNTFRFNIPATAMLLDPDVDYSYAITYVSRGHSSVIAAGRFKVAGNVGSAGIGSISANTPTFNAVVRPGVNQVLVVQTAAVPGQQGPAGPQGPTGAPGSVGFTSAALPPLGQTTGVPIGSLVIPGQVFPSTNTVLLSSAAPKRAAKVIGFNGSDVQVETIANL